MGRLRNILGRLEKSAEGSVDYFELADGSRHWFDPGQVCIDVFVHGSESLKADYADRDRPEPPDILKAIANAKDRRAAVDKLYPKGSSPFMVYDVDVLVERGELVPRSILAGCDDYQESRKRLSSSGDASKVTEDV